MLRVAVDISEMAGKAALTASSAEGHQKTICAQQGR